jgi:hypothetical protein
MEVTLLLLVLGFALHDINYFHTGFFQPYRAPGIYQVQSGLEAPDRQLALFGYLDDDK